MAAPQTQSKALPTAALINLDSRANEVLQPIFRALSVDPIIISENPVQTLQKKKFQACVLRLDKNAEPILQAARTSPRNRYVPIIGICSTAQEAIRFSRYGINAIINSPVERQDATRAVKGLHLLIINELRRYVRIPIVVECVFELNTGGKLTGVTRDVSYGGLSMRTPNPTGPDQGGTLGFKLPNGTDIKVSATTVWRYDPDLLGFRFEAGDERRLALRPFIEEYLKIF